MHTRRCITSTDVDEEITRLNTLWHPTQTNTDARYLLKYMTQEKIDTLDKFDIAQLTYTLKVCEQHNSMASAGRELFNVSRTLKAQTNDSSRLQKYLGKFGVKWGDIKTTP